MEVFRQMVVKKIAKRIAALGTGAVLVGSSILGASAAADLAMYPSQYIKDGKFTGVMVVGDKAAAEDVIGVSDVAISLQAAAVKKVSTGGAAVEVTGDAWKVGTSTKILELSENLVSGTNREAIATITSNSYIDESELSALSKEEGSNVKGDYEYEQRLYFEDATTGYVLFDEDDDDNVADFLKFDSGKQIARYQLEFTTQIESDVDDSAGSASTTGLFLTDFEDVVLKLFGANYEIVTAKRVTSTGDSVELTLMGGATKDTLLEGATKTYNVAGKDYEVTLTFVDADEAQFTVNGQTTRKLKDGDTDKLSDGTTVGVTEILYQDYAGGIHSATFFLGAQKLELKDTNIADTASSNQVEVEDEQIDEADVVIEGSDDNSTFKISRISVNMSADDDFWVPAGGKLSENPDLDEPEVLFTNQWDIEYKGLTTEDVDEIKLSTSGSDQYELEFVDGSGNKVKIPIANAVASSSLKFGDDDDDLILQENTTISKDDYLVVSDTPQDAGERPTYALRYRGSDASTDDNPQVRFQHLGTGSTIEQSISNVSSSTTIGPNGNPWYEIAQLKLGGQNYKVFAASIGADDFNVIVDLDGDETMEKGASSQGLSNLTGGNWENTFVPITSRYGAQINVYNGTNSTGEAGSNVPIRVRISTPNADHYDDLTPTVLNFSITASTTETEVTMSKAAGNNFNMKEPDDEDDTQYTYTSYGAWVKFDNPSDDPSTLDVKYPKNQVVPQVFITTKGASFAEVAGEGDAVMVQKIDVGATKLASEVADIMAVNSILVGGPCANAAAAKVMGNPADCTEGFEPGVGQIKMFDVGSGNVAMLVAGYSALDTRNAAQVVANYKQYAGSLKGTAVEVKKVNNQLTVAAPAPKAMAEEEEAMEEETA
jgi:hypothetical protein